jgi:hypothetical protein
MRSYILTRDMESNSVYELKDCQTGLYMGLGRGLSDLGRNLNVI